MCSRFLRNYADIEILRKIQPEDMVKLHLKNHSDAEVKTSLMHEFSLTAEQAEEEYRKAIE